MMEKNLSLDKNNELKLEDAMRRLDEVVALLDRENVDLEESLRLYEEGVRLVAFCTAKLNDAGDSLFVYVANISEHDQTAEIEIDNFKFKNKADVWSIGGCDLTETNTVDNKMNVSPKTKRISLPRKGAKYTFPRYSYTIIKLKK
jgi:exodeoxyribonuclease VII small subunit